MAKVTAGSVSYNRRNAASLLLESFSRRTGSSGGGARPSAGIVHGMSLGLPRQSPPERDESLRRGLSSDRFVLRSALRRGAGAERHALGRRRSRHGQHLSGTLQPALRLLPELADQPGFPHSTFEA